MISRIAILLTMALFTVMGPTALAEEAVFAGSAERPRPPHGPDHGPGGPHRPERPRHHSEVVRCGSFRGEYRECDVRGGRAFDVRLVREARESRGCRQRSTYGISRSGNLFVARGCIGSFEVFTRRR